MERRRKRASEQLAVLDEPRTVGNYCYLQDLFVAPEARGHGLGRALIEAVYREAKAAGASRVHWLTHETNATARALYDTLADRPGFCLLYTSDAADE